MQKLDNYGHYTLYGVFLECKDEIDKLLQSLPKGITKSKRINYRTFSKVISCYFKIYFQELIKGKTVVLFNKFGKLNVVKTNCIRYNPKKTVFYKDENNKTKSKLVNLDLKLGYWYFVFWDAPKKYRQYKFKIDLKYKHMYMKKVKDGYDYLDISLDKYGRYASPNYIHHIK
jgi:hypothetical protein